MKYLFLFILILNSNLSIACECIGKKEITVLDYNEANVIFIGTFVKEKIVQKPYGRIGFYIVKLAYKGVKVNDTMKVEDKFSSAACGLQELSINRDYLIYGYFTRSNDLFTSDCSRTTKVLNFKLPKDSLEIIRLSNLKSFGRIYDSLHTNFYADTSFLNSFITQTHKNGVQKFYNNKGELQAKGEYLNGLPSGTWEFYYYGDLKAKGNYIDGKREGIWFDKNPFDDDSGSYSLITYKNGFATPQKKDFFRNVISSECFPINNGEKWMEKLYHGNGKIRIYWIKDPPHFNNKGNMEEGLLNGAFRQYDDKGNLEEKGQMYKGFETGLWKYYKNGKLLKTEIKPSKIEIDNKKIND